MNKCAYFLLLSTVLTAGLFADHDDERRDYDSRMTRDFIESRREQIAEDQGFPLYPSPYDNEAPYRPYRVDETEGE